jgi:hypothetical protein
MDGKLLLVTNNVTDLSAEEIVRRYKSLADIERGFRVLKSEIEIAPVFHRLPERIKAHARLCFMALILYRVMRARLKLAGHEASPESALAQLRRIQRHTVTIDAGWSSSGVSTINQEQAGVIAALKLKKPTPDRQLSLLSWHAAGCVLYESKRYVAWCRTPGGCKGGPLCIIEQRS